MQTPHIATAADYADAMLVARRAKTTIFLILFFVLLAQISLFFVARYTDYVIPADAKLLSATQSVGASNTEKIGNLMHYVLGVTTFMGLTLPILLSFVLLLIVTIMLVGRLLGVSMVTSAYVWCLLAALLLFPWQALLNNVNLTRDVADFKIPGVLYTWSELTHETTGAKFSNSPIFPTAVLGWARFVGFPLLALIFLMIVQIKSNKGIRQALGETAPELDDLSTPD